MVCLCEVVQTHGTVFNTSYTSASVLKEITKYSSELLRVAIIFIWNVHQLKNAFLIDVYLLKDEKPITNIVENHTKIIFSLGFRL